MKVKSIFRRYLTVTMVIIAASFVFLGIMMMVFFSGFWKSEKENLLENNARSVAAIAAGAIADRLESPVEMEMLDILISNTANNIDADIFIVDATGGILRGNFHNSDIQGASSIDDKIAKAALEGKYMEQGKLGGFYLTDYFVVGVPLVVGAEGARQSVGSVFAATSSSPIDAYQSKTMEIFLLAALMALAIALLVASFFSYSFVRPLREMNGVLKAFGEGDMSARMKVESNDELGRVAASFNETAATLANSENIRRSFIANISHELKTPMTTIAGFIDGILDGTIPPEQEKKYLELVSDEVKRLSRLVKSMLDLSRIDGGEMKLSRASFDITETVINTLLTFSMPIEEKKIEVRGLDKVQREMVYADEDLIHQVVYNLIENAVKFTNPGGYIAFIITSGIDRVSVAIENSGDGIDKDDLPLIFDRFYKTDKSRSKDRKGMGLGLYLVRTILRLHGGDISVTSKERESTRFEFYIPKEKHTSRNAASGVIFDAEIISQTHEGEAEENKEDSNG